MNLSEVLAVKSKHLFNHTPGFTVVPIRIWPALVSAVILVALCSKSVAQADEPNRVGLVVLHGDGRQITRCIEFSEAEISGYDVLVRSGLSVVSAFDAGMGAAMCAIDGEGCPADDCFCQCQGSECVYWAYYHLVNGQWQYSGLGASSCTVHSGDVEGWAWGQGSIGGGGAQPPVIPFDQICAPSSPPTDTPVPLTSTSVPSTATSPPPTDTPLPGPTATSPPPTPEAWFRLDDNPIPAGACTNVRWDTTHALEVYLDGERVDLSGSREVCPTAPQEYQLRVVGAAGERTETLVLGVIGVAPSPTPTSQPAALPSPSPLSTSEAAAVALPSPSPIPESAAAPAPLPSTMSEPVTAISASPLPSPTPQRIAAVVSLPSPTRAAQPTPALSPSSSTVESTTDGQRPSTLLLGYTAFNLIMIGLLGWLIFRLLRRR
jgi:hypothetical protein